MASLQGSVATQHTNIFLHSIQCTVYSTQYFVHTTTVLIDYVGMNFSVLMPTKLILVRLCIDVQLYAFVFINV